MLSCLCVVGSRDDEDFPPDASSVGKWRGQSAAAIDAQIAWERASVLYRDSPLFRSGAFQAGDVSQGHVGNCWLIAAFIVLMQREPEVIKRAFLTQKSVRGRWRIRIFDRLADDWVIVSVDDHIPVVRQTRQPVFARSLKRDVWMLLLEKAIAKFVGTYAQLDGGHTAWALNALTGEPVFRLKRYDFADGAWRRLDATCTMKPGASRTHMGFVASAAAYDSDAAFLLVKAYCRRRAHLGASFGALPSDGSGIGHHSYGAEGLPTWYGLLGGHAYSVLDVQLFKFYNGKQLKLIKLRNPWGEPRWQGAWANGADEWTEHGWVREVCKPLGLRHDDGCFWMEWLEFSRVFDKLDVCAPPGLFNSFKGESGAFAVADERKDATGSSSIVWRWIS